MEGRIADGGSPESRLGWHPRWSAACYSGGAVCKTALLLVSELVLENGPRSGRCPAPVAAEGCRVRPIMSNHTPLNCGVLPMSNTVWLMKAWAPPSQTACTKPTSRPELNAPTQVRLWRSSLLAYGRMATSASGLSGLNVLPCLLPDAFAVRLSPGRGSRRARSYAPCHAACPAPADPVADGRCRPRRARTPPVTQPGRSSMRRSSAAPTRIGPDHQPPGSPLVPLQNRLRCGCARPGPPPVDNASAV
jgi:hypothetical protein